MFSTPPSILVPFDPNAYTFVPVEGYKTYSDAPCCAQSGVYLWCIECEGEFVANYVGMTTGAGGMRARLRTEHNDWVRGRHRSTTVDVDAFKRCRRVVLPDPNPEMFARATKELEPLWRILVAPLPSNHCKPVESALVNLLRGHPATMAFLGNRDKDRGYRQRPALAFQLDAPPIVGITVAVPIIQ